MGMSRRTATVAVRGRRAGRVGSMAATVAAAGFVLVGSMLATTAGAGAVDAVTVDQSALPGGDPCVPAVIGHALLTRTVESTPAHFRVTVVNRRTLCEPVDAVAAVYGMPLAGSAWPQRLVTTRPFRILGPSTTIITFAKGCPPVQFDVVTGPTPAVIDLPPAGPLHGPLLFPGDLATAEQYRGGSCSGAPPTTGGTTTTTTSTTTTTTVTPVVGGTTLVPTTTTPGGSTTTVSPAVAGESETAPDVAPSPAPAVLASTASAPATGGSPLASTGIEGALVAGAGAVMVVSGVLLLVASGPGRRRRTPSALPTCRATVFSTEAVASRRSPGP